MRPSDNDTICALSTPPGPGGIGIVRLSGNNAVGVSGRFVRLNHGNVGNSTCNNAINYGWVVNPNEGTVVDEVLVSVMRAPATYTREDVVEINCHGGPAVVRRVLELAIEAGARLAEPGEFTRRAFLNGRIDLTQAEAVMDVISSSTELALRAAMDQLGGGLGRRVGALSEGLAELLALAEASIDFPEEEIEYVPIDELKTRGRTVQGLLARLLDTYEEGRVFRDGLRVAIVGRPNVGKSSLLNLLCGSDRAIVTEVPGTTRDTVEELVNLGGIPVRLVDTAGIRQSDDIVEIEGVKRSERALEACDLALMVLDGSRPLDEADRELADRVRHRPFIAAVNKSDLPQAFEKETLMALAGAGTSIVSLSAKTGDGLDNLSSAIKEHVMGAGPERQPEAAVNLRHRESLKRAGSALARFMDGCEERISPEFLSMELKEALDAVGEVVGETTPDDVLDIIFSRFCIGK